MEKKPSRKIVRISSMTCRLDKSEDYYDDEEFRKDVSQDSRLSELGSDYMGSDCSSGLERVDSATWKRLSGKTRLPYLDEALWATLSEDELDGSIIPEEDSVASNPSAFQVMHEVEGGCSCGVGPALYW